MNYYPQGWQQWPAQQQAPAPAGPLAGPIISERPWAGKLAPARAHVAVVLIHKNGDHEVVWPHARKRPWWRALLRKPVTQYEIDLGLHQTEFLAPVPSSEDAFQFQAAVSIQWRVIDPSAVARHRVYDVKEALAPHAQLRMRGISRGFEITRSAAAEDAINEQLGALRMEVTDPARFEAAQADAVARGYLGAEFGLWTRTIVRLTLDQATLEHEATMKRLNRAIRQEEAEQALRALQQQNEQRNMADRISVYREIASAGDMDRFALQLARDPDAIATVSAIIREDELTNRHETVDFVKHMVDAGVIERHQISDQTKQALDWVEQATSRVIRDGRPAEIDGAPKRRGRAALSAGAADGVDAAPLTPSEAAD